MRSVGSIFLITIGSFLLGFLRDLLIAKEYGGGFQSDILFLSLSIPVLIENILGVALRDALIPYFSSLRASWMNRYQPSVRRVGKYLLLISVSLLLPLSIFPEFWLRILAPGWEASTLVTASVPFQIGTLFIPVLVWSYFLTGILNAGKRLVVPMARSIFLNIGSLVVLLFADVSVRWVLVGMLGGVVLHLIWMQLVVSREKFSREKPDSETGPVPSLRSTISGTAFPLFVSTIALQITFVAERFFASWLSEGSISHLSYAFRITTVPFVIFIFSFVTVLFPLLVSRQIESDRKGLRQLTSNGLKIALALMVPSAIFFAVFPESVIRILLERGEFTAADTEATAGAVAGYALGLPGLALSFMGARVAVAMDKASSLIPSAILALCVTIFFDLLFVRAMGVAGLAIACSLGATAQAFYLWSRIYRSIGLNSPGKMTLRCLVAGCLGYALVQIEIPFPEILRLVVGGIGLIGTFFFTLWILGEKRLISPSVLRFREECL